MLSVSLTRAQNIEEEKKMQNAYRTECIQYAEMHKNTFKITFHFDAR